MLLPLLPLLQRKLFLHVLPDGLINRWYSTSLIEEKGSFMVEAVKAQDNAQLHKVLTSVTHGGKRVIELLIECRQQVKSTYRNQMLLVTESRNPRVKNDYCVLLCVAASIPNSFRCYTFTL